MPERAAFLEQTRAWACYDCGKCTAVCPLARAGSRHSPRRQVLAANLGHQHELLDGGTLFACLTCSLCDSRCPAQVSYTPLVQNLRELAYREGVEPECPHGGALQSVMRMMAKGGTQQDRLGWLEKGLRTETSQGAVFYWTGCTVYFDALFPGSKVATVNSNRASVRALNALGVAPVVSPEERCCGHDLLWNGDRKSFELLARHNVDLVARSGATTLVISCAECLRTWKTDYLPFFASKPPKIQHITETLGERLPELSFRADGGRTVTYQDPCRLGRQLGIYEPPRRVMAALPGIELVEMRRSHAASICCAGGTWSHCDRFAKAIQVERLREARATGAQVLVTACPKCQIHLACAMKDPHLGAEIGIELKDVAELVAEALVPPAKT